MEKSLDRKLGVLAKDRFNAKAFILADAKDADMAFGIGAPGRMMGAKGEEGRMRTLGEYREQIRGVIRQGLVDIVLMSASTNELLTIEEGLFEGTGVTPAARANDATDVHVVREGKYIGAPSRPHATATIEHIQHGRLEGGGASGGKVKGANLGLYSCTFNNIPERDLETLEGYKAFRLEAERKGFRHFLEVFDPNVETGIEPGKVGGFVNDHIARMLAGVPRASRPAFLKIAYHGPRYMEELCRYDESLVVGILGGSAGTTYDAFKMLHDAKKHGARVALFGRKINHAENQLAFIECLRLIADDAISPEEGVKSYHGMLGKLGVRARRELAEDMVATVGVAAYGG